MKWISVKEQLPENGQLVTIRLVELKYEPSATEDGYLDSARFNLAKKEFGFYRENDDYKLVWHTEYTLEEVTHWTQYTGPKIRTLRRLPSVKSQSFPKDLLSLQPKIKAEKPKISLPIIGKAITLIKVPDEVD